MRRRLEGMLGSHDLGLTGDNFTNNRSFELQRYLAPVLAARWVVMHCQGAEPVITNDVGWTHFREPKDGYLGIAIPLDQRTVLGLLPCRWRRALQWRHDAWYTQIEHVLLTEGNHLAFNRLIAESAQKQIFGPTRTSVESVIDAVQTPRMLPPDPYFMMRSGQDLVANEFTWHRLVSASRRPSEAGHLDLSIDWEIVADGWHPDVVFPLNLGESLLHWL
jgi:hypothetical protein